MKKLNYYPVSLLILALTLSSPLSYAGKIYRFQDENGISTLSKMLPPYAAQQGYEILDDKSFRVIERVLSNEDAIAQNNAEQAAAQANPQEQELLKQKQLKEEQRKRLVKEQQIVDKNLLDIYPSIQDLLKTRDNYLAYISKQMEDSISQQELLQEKLHKLQQAAAEQELGGQSISDKLKQRIEATRQDIVDNQLHLEDLQADQAKQ